MDDAAAHGAELIQHKPGYNSVIMHRAEADVKAHKKWTYIPFGMEHRHAMNCTRSQVASIANEMEKGMPQPKRIVITLGSGMSAAGVLHGLQDLGLSIPVLGVRIGADPTKRLDRYAPAMWRQSMSIIDATVHHSYTTHLDRKIGGVQLDGHYEAKAVDYVHKGDLFWIIGVRAVLLNHCPR
jgi:1-aminocyclopropane-1-carboxylate deaminase/D-cysteine desulfhydrase-like pyridoxal-dependent ACC family enzyme